MTRRKAPEQPVPAMPPKAALPMEGIDESTWMDVIQKMDEVYSQLVHDETVLQEKNEELERTQQFIMSLLSAMMPAMSLRCSG